jgi:hypothetical protein
MGHPIPVAAAVLINGRDEILMQLRADCNKWAVPARVQGRVRRPSPANRNGCPSGGRPRPIFRTLVADAVGGKGYGDGSIGGRLACEFIAPRSLTHSWTYAKE